MGMFGMGSPAGTMPGGQPPPGGGLGQGFSAGTPIGPYSMGGSGPPQNGGFGGGMAAPAQQPPMFGGGMGNPQQALSYLQMFVPGLFGGQMGGQPQMMGPPGQVPPNLGQGMQGQGVPPTAQDPQQRLAYLNTVPGFMGGGVGAFGGGSPVGR
jgi:hypothetical protein